MKGQDYRKFSNFVKTAIFRAFPRLKGQNSRRFFDFLKTEILRDSHSSILVLKGQDYRQFFHSLK